MEKKVQCNINKNSIKRNYDQFYSAEVLLNELNTLYQFKIWNIPPKPMFVLVKENSAVLGCLNVGDILKMKYYSTDTLCPTENLKTKITNITMENNGRFKGHYVVGLEIDTSEDQQLSN